MEWGPEYSLDTKLERAVFISKIYWVTRMNETDPDVITANEELSKINEAKRRSTEKRKVRPRYASDSSPFMSLEQVLELVPIARSTLYLMVSKGEFPSQIKLGKRAAVWSREEVRKWIDNKLYEKYNSAGTPDAQRSDL